MARIELVLAHDPRLLLQTAAAEFLTPQRATLEEPFPTPKHLLALRQGGLRDELYALAAASGVRGWFDPPVCTFAELPAWLGSTERVPLGDFERLALVNDLLRANAGPVLGRLKRPEAFAEAVDHFFGELTAENVSPDGFRDACARVRGRDEFQQRRDAELADLFTKYIARLDATKRRSGKDALADCALAVEQNPVWLRDRLRGRRELRIVGLLDLSGGWRQLLATLQRTTALDRVAIYTSVELPLPLELEIQVDWLPEAASTATRLFSETDERIGNAREVDAPDAEREIEEIALRVRELIEGGVAPQRIAVVPRQARPGTDRALRALREFGVPVTARQRVAYVEVPAIRALLALFDAGAERWSRHSLVELAEQPYFDLGLDAQVLNHVGYRRRVEGLGQWEDALDALLRLAEEREAETTGKDEHRASVPASGRVRATRAGFTALRVLAQPLESRQPEKAWLAWLEDAVATDTFGIQQRIYRIPPERYEIARLDLAAWSGLASMLAEWRRAADAWGDDVRLDVATFAARLRDMLQAEVGLWTETARGVQVVEALAAAFRSFDHTFIVGMEAGGFPVSPPASPLLDAAEREELAGANLPLAWRRDWETHERELFRVLVAGTRNLTVSHARVEGRERETVRSSFVEALADACVLATDKIASSRVRTPRLPLCVETAKPGALRVARIERERMTGRTTPHNGAIESPALQAWIAAEFGPERVWSATQIESFAKCPWSYFSGRLLRLEKLEDPDQDLDPRVRGTILHDALRRFYDAELERADGPVLIREADRERAQRGIEVALDAALDAQAYESWLGHPALRDVRRAELRRLLRKYIDFEIDDNEKFYNTRSPAFKTVRMGAGRHEVAFDDLELNVAGARIRLRGSIDRVDESIDDDAGRHYVAVIDYKSSEYAVPGRGSPGAWNDGVMLQLPLYAEAMRMLKPGTDVARLEYRTLSSPATRGKLALVKVDRKIGDTGPNEKDVAKYEAALGHVAAHLIELRAGRFPARPAPSCGCPPYCHARDVCRTSGGPKEGK